MKQQRKHLVKKRITREGKQFFGMKNRKGKTKEETIIFEMA